MYKTLTVSFLGKQYLKSGQEKGRVNFQCMAGSCCECHPAENFSVKVAQKEHRLQNKLKIEYSKYRPKFSHVQNVSILKT